MSIPKNWMGRITRRPFFDSNIGREVRQRCRKIKSITDYLSRRCTESLLNIERSPSPDPEIISISASPVNSVKSELVKKEGVRALQGMVRGHASLMSIGTDEQQNSNGGRRSSENTTTVEKGARGRSENPNRVSRSTSLRIQMTIILSVSTEICGIPGVIPIVGVLFLVCFHGF